MNSIYFARLTGGPGIIGRLIDLRIVFTELEMRVDQTVTQRSCRVGRKSRDERSRSL